MNRRSLKRLAVVALAALLMAGASGASAGDADAEIEYLLTAVGDSGCTFIRNGKSHSAEEAEAHLRMKYRRGRKYASTTEQFIQRLATASSWTKRPYAIRCGDAEPEPTGDWFHERLDELRRASQAGTNDP